LIISRLSSSAGGPHLSLRHLAGPGLIVTCLFSIIAGSDRRRCRSLRSCLQSIKSTVFPPSLPLTGRVPLNKERNQHQQREGIPRGPHDAAGEVLII
jgi:hypothetical protein